MQQFLEWFDRNVGADGSSLDWYWRLLILGGVILAAYLVDFIFVNAIIPTLRKITEKTDTEVDDILLSEKVVRSFSNILPPIILTFALPFVTQGTLEIAIARLTEIYIIINVTRFLCILVDALFEAMLSRGKQDERNRARIHSMKGLVQTVQIFICAIAAILVVSVIVQKSPIYLISGLGAMAAVLMLVFQDSIKGLVAGIQLLFNNMLEVGDWITMPARNVDGTVIEITLMTVKVRNWDNTILTIPPYNLLNETFQNWRGMRQSDGRRLTRNIHIDLRSIHFLTSAEAKKWGIDRKEKPEMTNLEVYRTRLHDHLMQDADLNPEMGLMVRQMAAGSDGIPLQIYAFTRTKVWAEYEDVQSRVIEYALSSLREYNLVAFQRGGLPPEVEDNK